MARWSSLESVQLCLFFGAEIGVSGAISQDWNSNSFIESISKPNQVGVPVGFKAGLGLGIAGNKNSLELSLGFQADASISTINMKVTESVSLSDDESDAVSKKSDLFVAPWLVRDQKAITDEDGNVTGYSGSVYTKDTKGNFVNAGISVTSGMTKDENGKPMTNKIWVSLQSKLGYDKDSQK